MNSSEQSGSTVHMDKYVSQLEKRILEQEQLIALLNEKLAAFTSSSSGSKVGAEAGMSGSDGRHGSRKPNDYGVSFVGSRKSDNVQAVVNTKYSAYFVSRVGPDVSAEVLARDLLSSVSEMTSVKCTKMKTRHTSYASFHIVVPADQCHLVESDGAWPEGSFVKMFSGRLLPAYVLETYDSNAPVKVPVKSKPAPKKLGQSSAKQSGGQNSASGSLNSPSNGQVIAGSSPLSSTTSKAAKVSAGKLDAKSPKNGRPLRSGTKIV